MERQGDELSYVMDVMMRDEWMDGGVDTFWK